MTRSSTTTVAAAGLSEHLVHGVRVVRWNPTRPLVPGRLGGRLPWRRPARNFGDLLGPVIVGAEADRLELPTAAGAAGRLAAVGSIMHLLSDGDAVWGAGVNGKIPDDAMTVPRLDVRAVRGPRTRQVLDRRGIAAPEIYGDPALLLPGYRPDLVALSAQKKYDVTVVPNLNDLRTWRGGRSVLDPRSRLETCLRRIVRSRLVVGSSLHAIILADAFGVPARIVRSEREDPFKYLDYLEGTGRHDVVIADDVPTAIALGGHEELVWDPRQLLSAFPRDLWAAHSG